MCAGAQGRLTIADQASWPCEDSMCSLRQAVWPPRLSRNHGAIPYAIASSCLNTSLRLSAPGEGGKVRGVVAIMGSQRPRPDNVRDAPWCQTLRFARALAWTQRTANQCPYPRPSNLCDYHPPLRGGGWGSFMPTSRPQTRYRTGQTFGALHAQGAPGSQTAWLPSGSPAPGRRKPRSG